jgi:hypothetical protein
MSPFGSVPATWRYGKFQVRCKRYYLYETSFTLLSALAPSSSKRFMPRMESPSFASSTPRLKLLPRLLGRTAQAGLKQLSVHAGIQCSHTQLLTLMSSTF